jgi:Flp pilus assembly pilin Flp
MSAAVRKFRVAPTTIRAVTLQMALRQWAWQVPLHAGGGGDGCPELRDVRAVDFGAQSTLKMPADVEPAGKLFAAWAPVRVTATGTTGQLGWGALRRARTPDKRSSLENLRKQGGKGAAHLALGPRLAVGQLLGCHRLALPAARTTTERDWRRAVWRDRRGASLVEYIILIGVVALLAIGAWRVFSAKLATAVKHEADKVAKLGADEPSADDPLAGPTVSPDNGATGAAASSVGATASAAPPVSPAASAAQAAAAARAAYAAEVRKVAQALVKVAGTATDADRQAVLREVEKMPLGGLKAMQAKGMKITVVQNTITDALPQLKGVTPRGWPPGSTWDSVPGLYDPATKQVVIATHNGTVPATGNGHGSSNLVVHETAHAIDAAVNGNASPAFQAARQKDIGKLSSYETQPGDAGLQESYAESMARHYSTPAASASSTPELDKYWSTNPLDNP